MKIALISPYDFSLPGGVQSHIFVSWLHPFKEQKLVIVGKGGMVVFDDTAAIDQKLVLYSHRISWKNGVPSPEKKEVTINDFKEGMKVQWKVGGKTLKGVVNKINKKKKKKIEILQEDGDIKEIDITKLKILK